jgi:hypothetical protein
MMTDDFSIADVRLSRTEGTHYANRRETYTTMVGDEVIGEAKMTKRNTYTTDFDGVRYREVFGLDVWIEEKSSTRAFIERVLAEGMEAMEASGGAVRGTTHTRDAIRASGRRYVVRKDERDTIRTITTTYSRFFFHDIPILYVGMKATPCVTGVGGRLNLVGATIVANWSLTKTDETPLAVPMEDMPRWGTDGTTENVPVGRLAELIREMEADGGKLRWRLMKRNCEFRHLLHHCRSDHIRRWKNGELCSDDIDGARRTELVLPPVSLSDFRLRKGSERVKPMSHGERCGEKNAYIVWGGWVSDETADWARIEGVRTMRDALKREVAERVFDPARVRRMASAHGMDEIEYLERV